MSQKEIVKTFQQICKKTDTEEPADEDVRALQALLREHPDIWREAVPCMTDQVALQLMGTVQSTALAAEAMKQEWQAKRQEFTRDVTHPLELALAEHAAVCWLRMYAVEQWYTKVMHKGSAFLSMAQWAEKRLSATQRRYLRACETLARVRKLIRRTPAIQVNIAAARGQQVNVAGDMERS